jgi:hypothetical protein
MDTYGPKVVMVVSFLASAAVYGMTALATNMRLLYASCFPSLLQHGVLAARVWISNSCSAEHRAALLGYIGLSYSMGQVRPTSTLSPVTTRQNLVCFVCFLDSA